MFQIHDDTSLLPHVIADVVLTDVAIYTRREIPNAVELADELGDRADHTYATDEQFRERLKQLDGRFDDSSREFLFAFMRRWAANELRRRHPSIYELLPQSFSRGIPLPSPAPVLAGELNSRAKVCDRR